MWSRQAVLPRCCHRNKRRVPQDLTTNQINIMNCKTKLLTLAGVLLVAAVAQADPKETFEKTCAKCHGADGTGQTKMGQKLGCRDYTDAKVSDSLKDDVAFKALKEGLTNDDGKTLMKPVQDLSDDDIKGLIAYVRAFKK